MAFYYAQEKKKFDGQWEWLQNEYMAAGMSLEDIEAMQKFDEGDNHNPDYKFILGGSGNGAALAQTDYRIEKDENGKDAKLCIFGSRTDSGFVICEFPIKQEEED